MSPARLGRGERVLARVGVEMPPDQELVRLPRPQLGGELGDTAEEGDGGEEFGAGGGVYGGGGCGGGGGVVAVYGGRAVYAGRVGGGVNAGYGRGGVYAAWGVHTAWGVHATQIVHSRRGTPTRRSVNPPNISRAVNSLPDGRRVNSPRGRRGVNPALPRDAEPRGDHPLQRGGEAGGEALVGECADLQPDGRSVMDEQEDAARVDEGGGRALGVSDELLPDAFTEGHFGEFPLVAQPGLDLGEGEGGAGLGAADRLGEVGVAAAPVTDGGAADAREPCDAGGGHFRGVVLHAPRSPRPAHGPGVPVYGSGLRTQPWSCGPRSTVTPSIPTHARSTHSRRVHEASRESC